MLTAYTIWAGTSGIKLKNSKLLKNAQLAVYGQFWLITICVSILLYALISRDFSFRYVAEYSDRKLPLFYTISALWAGQAGSLLFWTWLLTIFNALYLFFNRNRESAFKPFVFTIHSAVTIFFLSLIIFSTNPFEKSLRLLPDGFGLNPLLQNPEMVFHPPTLFLGFVGFTIPFAFALAALMKGDLSTKWLNECRNWSLFAWVFLTIGNLLGAQWAYVELGWGGYWAWDPVENASLLPWLTGTAFVHSLMAQRSLKMMKAWNVSLAVTTFLLTILGTFITRSGIISSVHSFGKSNIGTLFLVFMGIVFVVFVALLIWRRKALSSEKSIDNLLTREFSFLLNNFIFVILTITILWGTLYPAFTELFIGKQITLGEGFFNKVSIPFGIVLFLLLAICPLFNWRETKKSVLLKRGLYSFIGAIIFAVVLFIAGIRHLISLAIFSIAFLAVAILVTELLQSVAIEKKRDGGFLKTIGNILNKHARRYSGYLIHVGVVMIFLSIVGTTAYKQEKELTLQKGESTTIGDYQIVYNRMGERHEKRHDVLFAEMEIFRDGKSLGKLFPQSHVYKSSMRESQRTSEIDLRSTLKEDLYISLASYQNDGSATFVIMLNPLMNWMWIGGFIITVGIVIILVYSVRKKRLELVKEKKVAVIKPSKGKKKKK
jgi:cytochrome c-type biogenesis protein CcmF